MSFSGVNTYYDPTPFLAGHDGSKLTGIIVRDDLGIRFEQ
jgi:hypothetical protein